MLQRCWLILVPQVHARLIETCIKLGPLVVFEVEVKVEQTKVLVIFERELCDKCWLHRLLDRSDEFRCETFQSVTFFYKPVT